MDRNFIFKTSLREVKNWLAGLVSEGYKMGWRDQSHGPVFRLSETSLCTSRKIVSETGLTRVKNSPVRLVSCLLKNFRQGPLLKDEEFQVYNVHPPGNPGASSQPNIWPTHCCKSFKINCIIIFSDFNYCFLGHLLTQALLPLTFCKERYSQFLSHFDLITFEVDRYQRSCTKCLITGF